MKLCCYIGDCKHVAHAFLSLLSSVPTLHISLLLCPIPSPALTYLCSLNMADPDPS